MKYDIRLKIGYEYAAPVTGGRHLLRLQPITLNGLQRVVASTLSYDPEPQEEAYYSDFYGNQVASIGYEQRQNHLNIDMQARVQIERIPNEEVADTDLAQLISQRDSITSLDPFSPHHFTSPSPRAPWHAEIVDYARKSLTPGIAVASLVDELCQRIRDDFKYDSDATEVDTPVANAFKERHGVCQDFSHILIIGLRGLGIPAGYASGFIRTLPPPGKKRLQGADAMHAWVRVWCGSPAGWIGFDPTNAIRANLDHIVIGYGRDYGDVAPIVGVLKSTGEHETSQSVDVIAVED